jgi:nucleosome binding factor SPN SPT16 subunit
VELARRRPADRRDDAAPVAAGPIVSYRSTAGVPALHLTNLIYIGAGAQTIFFQIYGVMVPFHIGVIKGAIDERGGVVGRSSYLKITFDVPKPDQQDPGSVYIKELLFASHGSAKFRKIAKQIRDLRVIYLMEIKLRKEAKEVYIDEKFEPLKDQAPPRIGGAKVQIRPPLVGKKNFGNLEAHRNAFRYRAGSSCT